MCERVCCVCLGIFRLLLLSFDIFWVSVVGCNLLYMHIKSNRI
jgi:hypothetical protein